MATARENGANAVSEAVAVEVGDTEESFRGAQGMGGEYLEAFTEAGEDAEEVCCGEGRFYTRRIYATKKDGKRFLLLII